MSAPTINNYFYGSIGQQIDHVEHQVVHFDKDMKMHMGSEPESPETVTDAEEPAAEKASNTTGLEPLFKYIHVGITDDQERLKVHRKVQNLVSNYPIPDICAQLKEMKKNKELLLPQSAELVFAELQRMGMPGEQEKGFSKANFVKFYA